MPTDWASLANNSLPKVSGGAPSAYYTQKAPTAPLNTGTHQPLFPGTTWNTEAKTEPSAELNRPLDLYEYLDQRRQETIRRLTESVEQSVHDILRQQESRNVGDTLSDYQKLMNIASREEKRPLVPITNTCERPNEAASQPNVQQVQQYSMVLRQPTDRLTMENLLNLSTGPYRHAWKLLGHIQAAGESESLCVWATLQHLQEQYAHTIAHTVQEARLASGGTGNEMETYVELRVGQTSPWACLYFHLRSGNVAAAQRLALELGESGLAKLLDGMLTPGAMIDEGDRQALIAMQSSNVYQTAVYALFSMAEFPDSASPGLNMMEDYMWANLWQVALSSNPPASMNDLKKSIREFGPSHFGSGWGYAFPLLLTQQYGEALIHLATSSHLSEAAHLALFWPGEESARSHILATYADHVAHVSVLDALEYLGRIPTDAEGRHATARLLAKTKAIEVVVGKVDAQGVRVPNPQSSLDRYFSPTDVGFILEEAATLLHRGDLQSTNMACMCYMLAGKYAKVLQLLHSLIIPRTKDVNFWMKQLGMFRDTFIDKGTAVSQKLERENPDLLVSSRLIVHLTMFLGMVESQRWLEAEGLLLDELSSMLTATPSIRWDPLIQDSFPAFLVGAMRVYHSLFVLHRRQHDVNRLKQLQEYAQHIVQLSAYHKLSPQETLNLGQLEAQMIL